MIVLKFEPPINAQEAEADIVAAIKAALYKYSNVITVAQAVGCLEIAKSEILRDAE